MIKAVFLIPDANAEMCNEVTTIKCERQTTALHK